MKFVSLSAVYLSLTLLAAQSPTAQGLIPHLLVPPKTLQMVGEHNIRFSFGTLSHFPASDPTKFLCATICGDISIVRQYLAYGGDPNVPGENGVTGLMCAAANGHRDLVIELLKHKELIINLADDQGETAADHAQKNGKIDIFELLKSGECSPRGH